MSYLSYWLLTRTMERSIEPTWEPEPSRNPAATMIQAGLADPRMRIEIEVDAIIGSA
jgi:enamine deaminase RidA (YjgF/YER057c/UK114 family)